MATMDEMREAFRLLEARVSRLEGRAQAASGGAVATTAQLDDKYGDPEIRFDPRAWKGPSMKGRHFSDCPAEYLDALARMYDDFAVSDEAKGTLTAKGQPSAPYKRKDAALARGWAARMRESHGSAVPDEESIPF